MKMLRLLVIQFGRALGFVIVWLVNIIEYLYLTRVPLVGLLLLFGLPNMATGFARTLVIGAYDMGTFWEAFLVELAVCAVAASTYISARIVWSLGEKRYGLRLGKFTPTVEKAWIVLIGLAVIYNTVMLLRISDPSVTWKVAGGLACALALAVAARFAVIAIENRLMDGTLRARLIKAMDFVGLSTQPGYLTEGRAEPKDIEPGHATALAFGAIMAVIYVVLIQTSIPALVTVMMVIALGLLYLGALAFFLDRYRVPLLVGILAYCWGASKWWQNDHYYRVWPTTASDYHLPAPEAPPTLKPVKDRDGAGPAPAIADQCPTQSVTSAQPATSAAATTAAASPAEGKPEPAATPLSSATESPPPSAPSADAKPQEDLPHELSPRAVIHAAMAANRPIVVVASAGGGIQATAWTTAALERIGAELRAIDPKVDFPCSVRLISGVSGGSVGGLFYAMAMDRPGADRFRQADIAAENSGLGQAMRGLLRDDLVRALVPFVILNGKPSLMNIYADRGHELEMAWIANAEEQFKNGGSGLSSATLSQWGIDALQLRRPALVFNSTLVETGERFAISTIPTQKSKVGCCEFRHRYNAELPMTTAARLSATFPVISPTARPGPAEDSVKPGFCLPGPQFWPLFPRGGNYLHAVDGGYYENSGVVGAVEWLNDAFEEMRQHGETLPSKVLFIKLNAFPHPASVDETQKSTPNDRAVDDGMQSQGTLYDLVSPLFAIMNVRDSGQKAFADLVFQLFRERWKLATGTATEITPVEFYYNFDSRSGKISTKKDDKFFGFVGPDAYQQPLSWHLRPCEKADITAHLEGIRTTVEFDQIKDFFGIHEDH